MIIFPVEFSFVLSPFQYHNALQKAQMQYRFFKIMTRYLEFQFVRVIDTWYTILYSFCNCRYFCCSWNLEIEIVAATTYWDVLVWVRSNFFLILTASFYIFKFPILLNTFLKIGVKNLSLK